MGKAGQNRLRARAAQAQGPEPLRRLRGIWGQSSRRDLRDVSTWIEKLPIAQAVAVLSADLWERWLAGQRVPAETYLDLRQDLRSDDKALDLVYGEFLVREQMGEAAALAEYIARFPEFEPQLRRQFELHRALASAENGDSVEETTSPDAPGLPPEDQSNCSPRQSPAALSVEGYELLGELGRGGMGVVYKARQVRLDRLVALKVILAGGHAGTEHLARFRKEGELLARIQHPNIIQIYEVGEQDGRPFFAMEYVDGESLAQRFSGIPLQGRHAAHLVETLARAIHAANERGVIHRDLKPANILMTSGGVLKITDFGLAKQLDNGAGPTRSGELMGTPSYMAPEQVRGRTTLMGAATDVYGLGAILYELLAGRPPFHAETALDTVLLVLNDEPISPARWQQRIPHDLETICLKCLRKDPGDRYPDGAALAEDLRRFLTHRPINARRVGPLGRARLWWRRKPTQAALTISVAILLVLIAVGATVAAGRLREELWTSYMAQARASRGTDLPGRSFDALSALAKAAGIRPSLELRNEAVAAMTSVDIRLVQEREVGPSGATMLAFDAELERYAVGDAEGNIDIRRVADNRDLLRLSNPGRPAWALQFSPNGQLLAARFHPSAQDEIAPEFRVWDTNSGAIALRDEPGWIVRDPHTQHGPWDFSPDSRRIAMAYLDGSIEIRDLSTGGTVDQFPSGSVPYRIAFSPDGRALAASCWKPAEVWVRDLETGTVLRFPHPTEVRGIAWHPESKLLAAACTGNDIYIWDVVNRTGQPRSILKGHEGSPRWLAFNHSGDLLASAGWDGTVRLWDPWIGKQRVVSAGCDFPPQFSPDGRRLGFGLDRSHIGIWEVASGHECRILCGHEGPWNSPHTVDVSPDGRVLASSGGDGVRLWDLDLGRQIAFLDAADCISAFFHAEGRALAVNDSTGVWRWPIDVDLRVGGVRVRAASPQTILKQDGLQWMSLSRRANVLVVGDPLHERALLLSAERPADRYTALGPHPNVNKTAISADGRWVATSTWHGTSGTKVWDVGTGQLAKDLGGADADVAFSPEGSLLVVGSEVDYRSWKTGTWQPGWRLPRDRASLPGPVAFSADGRTLAIALSTKLVRLIDPANGRTLADLMAPDPRPITCMCFSPDQGRLVVGSANHLMHVWDLQRIRGQLADMGLDWESRP
jgi:eukaryotic-like serine/threonine-protein kinase